MTDPAPFAFVEAGADAACRAALDRADRLRDDAAALAALWPQARVILLDEQGHALADADGRLCAPRGAQVSEGPGGAGAGVFLGLDADGGAWFALDAALAAFRAPRTLDLRSAAALWPAFDASVFAQARAMQHWRRRHRHCGVCGGEVAFARGGWLGRCARCEAEHYPRTDPAVIVAVSDGERLLLGRQRSWPPRRWSVLAGFVEPGETLEQTVAREVLEETGVRVRRCRYLASQPWPFPGSLMLGFVAAAEPDAARAGDELEEARWFTREDVLAASARGEWGGADDDGEGPVLSPGISISRWLIGRWLAGERA
ncbi:NAD(+) diphosphatase [Vulcaniibacterium tengchongense]|uniref:NAD(+) diphosphatase n=1 Tax=Vulcaniibacterium tengchongense TaxID=1273429 RepID=A0A3N4V3G7_9GAMM|nr:NAD(+) diphosphatase [Vulcaniibacterium tengchongense]RPE75805.1 NAD+ diphosphatase [Vulcaniibacterium tengchongense]